MAKLSTYEKDNSISGEDLLAGSNYVSLNTYNTKNFKLADLVNFIEGQITISTQQATLKANGGLVVENINSTDQLAVNLSHTNITGQLANSDLVNSSITINGTAVSLGGSITIGEVTGVTAGTYLNGGGTEGTVTLNHDSTSRSDTTSNAAPAYGATFTAIDSITTNATGHITAANLKTITIPASDDTNTTYTVEAIDDGNDAKIRLVGANPSSTDDVKLKAGSNITINVNEITDEIEIVGTAFGNTFTVANETAHLALNTSSGDLVIRTDQSKTYIDNGTNASPNVMSNYTELQFSGIQQIDLAEGPGIDLEDHAGNAITTLTQNNNDLKVINTLATSSERGGIKIGYTESGKNYPVELDSEKAFVNVPWVNTNQLTEWVLTDDDDDNTTIDHGKHVKFVMATGVLGTNTTGAGTDADPYLVTLTSPDSNTTYTAGGGLDLTGTEFSHTDTSSQASVNNSGRTYIQDITLDTYGHVTGLVSATETVLDTNQLTTWDLLDDDDDSFTISHDKHVKFTSSTGSYGTNITGTGTSSDPYVVAIKSPNDTVPNTFRTIKVDTNDDGTANETIGATEELKLLGGANVTLAESAGTVTITSTDNNTTNWNFKVDTGTATNIAAGDTVTFTGGTNVTLAQNGNTIDIAATDTTTNYYLDGITKSGNTLTFSVNGATNQDYTFGSNAFNSSTIYAEPGIFSGGGTPTLASNVTAAEIRTLIGAGTSSFDGDYDSLTNKPTIPSGNQIIDWTTDQGNTNIHTGNYNNTQLSNAEVRAAVEAASDSNVFTDADHTKLNGIEISATADQTITAGNGLSGGGTGNVTLTNSLFSDGKFFTVTANAAGGSLSLAQGLAASWNDSGGGGEVDIFFRDGGTNHATNTLYFHSYNGTDTKQIMKLGGASNVADTYVTMSGTLDVDGRTTLGTSGTANLYLGNVISPSSSNKGARFHSNNNDFYFDFQGDATQHWFLRDYDGSGGTHTRFSFDFINAKFTAAGDVVAFGSPSDKTLKENIKPIDNALDKIEKLQGVTFDWKEQDITNLKEDIGFIAQDVQKVLPELVRENKDGKLSLRHQGIIPVLLEAIKELSDKVKALENGSTK